MNHRFWLVNNGLRWTCLSNKRNQQKPKRLISTQSLSFDIDNGNDSWCRSSGCAKTTRSSSTKSINQSRRNNTQLERILNIIITTNFLFHRTCWMYQILISSMTILIQSMQKSPVYYKRKKSVFSIYQTNCFTWFRVVHLFGRAWIRMECRVV